MNTLNGNFIERTIPDLKDATLDLLIGGVPSTMNTADFAAAIATPPELEGTSYVYVSANGTDVENAAELQAAYTTAQGMFPSATNRITIIAAPGYYNFDDTTFTLNTQYINLVSLDGNRSIIFNSSNNLGTLWITENNIFVKGVDVQSKSLSVGNNLSSIIVENCKGGICSFGFNGNISGTFIDCEGGNSSFAGRGFSTGPIGALFNTTDANASGTFINCKGGFNSFGSIGFVFGTSIATASGSFTNCTAASNSFGAHSFGDATASGSFTNCTSLSDSFGNAPNGTSIAIGVFNNCVSGGNSFGAFAQGTFNSCIGGNTSFGTIEAGGIFNNCISGSGSFGEITGSLTGRLYYCRLTSGTFSVVNSGGRTVYCIDGNNDPNNQ
jgi:hypothetical protein